MRNIWIVLLLLAFIGLELEAQHKCGVTYEDGQLIRQRLLQNKEAVQKQVFPREDVLYVPIKFHLVAQNDGVGRIEESAVYKQLCKLNEEYQPVDMVFYMREFNYMNSNSVYDQPYTNSAHQTMVATKLNEGPNAINVFVVETADNPNSPNVGTTLAYYNPNGDYIVIRQDELNTGSSTLSHEVGHFFSLNHPFYGWECEPYDETQHGNPLTITTVPTPCVPGASTIEKVNGNCANTADDICDTPPDYLFAFSSVSSGCIMNTTVLDSDGNEINTMTNNMMSYFTGCVTSEFTPMQIEIMRADYMSGPRSYIRSGYVPNESEVNPSFSFSIIEPPLGSTTESFNGVFMDWEDVPNADNYYVRVFNSTFGADFYFPGDSELFLSNLEPDETYFWFILPYNETSTCHDGISGGFKTGEGTTSVNELSSVSSFKIYPNPANLSKTIQVDIVSLLKMDGQISINNIDGKEMYRSDISIEVGLNQIPLQDARWTSGVYLITLQFNDGITTQRLIIN